MTHEFPGPSAASQNELSPLSRKSKLSIELSDTKERSDIPYHERFLVLLSFLTFVLFVNMETSIFGPALLKI